MPAYVGQHRDADVFGHPDARDRVVWPVGDVAVVLDADLDHVTYPSSTIRLRAYSACSRDRVTPDDVHAVGACRVQGEGPPAAADVEHPHAGGQAELAGHQIAFGVLSHGQTVLGCAQYPHEYVIDSPSTRR